jgi:tetratricopeptide (TPR) repeat protein
LERVIAPLGFIIVKPAITPWLRSAQGFFDLGMFDAAWATLDDLEPSAKAHPETLMFRLDILSAQDRWHEAAALGAGYCRDWPTHCDLLLKMAEALIELTDYDKALLLLRGASESLHKDAMYYYTVASCACRVGRLEEAKAALSECFNHDGTFPQHALSDPNFEPIWQSFGPPSQWGLISGNLDINLKDLSDLSKGPRPELGQ